MSAKSHARHVPIAIDLFAGCGGLTSGLKTSGFEVISAVDNDSMSVLTYQMNHPEVRVWQRDILTLSAMSMRRALGLRSGQLDLLAGCPPCQAFSSLRTLNGGLVVRHKDKNLLFQFVRFVRIFKPKAIMVENVPGLAADRRIVEFCGKLASIGYQSEFRVFDAANYGVPQRRRRMILVASRRGDVRFARETRKRMTVRDVIADLPRPGNSGDHIHDLPEKRSRQMRERIRKTPRDGGSRADLPKSLGLECHQKCNGFRDVYGRMSWDQVAPTITTGCFNPSKGRFLHPVEDRAITMREAALLQGFPPDYKFPGDATKCAIATMIGNALPPPFVAAHARLVRNVIETE